MSLVLDDKRDYTIGMNELTDYEKLVEGMNQLANVVREYYNALIEKGFSDKDALVLTVEYQRSIVETSRKA